jgi:hypothetical protein
MIHRIEMDATRPMMSRINPRMTMGDHNLSVRISVR